MLRVRIGNECFDISQKNKISLEYNSSFFDDYVFRGSYSLPFSFPLSNKNKRLIKHRHVLQNAKLLDDPEECFLDILNIPYKKGIFKINKTSEQEASAFLQFDSAVISESIQNTSIRSVPMGGDRYIGNTVVLKREHFNGQTYSFAHVNQYTFFPIYNPNFYKVDDESVNPNFVASANGLINPFINGEFLVNSDTTIGLGDRIEYCYVPFPQLHYVVSKVCDFLGYKATGDFFDDQEFKACVIYNTVAIDKITTIGVSQEKRNTYQTHINLQNHVPDMTISDFFQAIRYYLFINITVNSSLKTIEFRKFKSILKDENYVDWTKNTSPIIENDVLEKRGIKYQVGYDNEDALFDKNEFVREYSEGTGGRSITTEASSLYMSKDYLTQSTYQHLVPHAEQVGNSLDENYFNNPNEESFYLGKNNFSLRLLFYRGRRPDSNNNYYPFGSSDVWDYSGTRVGSYSLDWEGEYGRKNRMAKEYINFWEKTKPFTVRKKITPAELLQFEQNPNTKVMIRGIKGLVDSIKFGSDFDKSLATINLYRT